MDFNQSEKLLGKMIIIVMVCVLLVVSISILKFTGIFSLIFSDDSDNEFIDYVSETFNLNENKENPVETSPISVVSKVDSAPATDSRFYGSPIDIRGDAPPPEELGYPVYNKIFEDSLIFKYSTYAYEISLEDNPFIISYTVEPQKPSVTVESDSAHSGNIDYGEEISDESKPDDCPDCVFPIGSSNEFFMKITVTNPETDEIIYTCGYAGDYSSDLYQWHLIPDHIEKARVDLEGNNIDLDLKFGAGQCEDPDSDMIMYRGYDGSSDSESGLEIEYEDPESEVWG